MPVCCLLCSMFFVFLYTVTRSTSAELYFPFSTTSGFAVFSWVFSVQILCVQSANRGSGWEQWRYSQLSLMTSSRTVFGLFTALRNVIPGQTLAIGYGRSRVALGRSNSFQLQQTPAFKWVNVCQLSRSRLSVQINNNKLNLYSA